MAMMDKDSLHLCEGSYIDKSLRRKFSDILYRATFNDEVGYIYLLVEHQSEADKMMPWRILQYTVNIMEKHLILHNTEALPLVFPLVLYHGKKRYPYSTDVRELVAAPSALIDTYFLKPLQV